MSESSKWIVTNSERVHENPWFSVRKDELEIGESSGTYYVVERVPAAVAIAEDADENLFVIRQYRYPVGTTTLDFPVGRIDPESDPLETARHELLEEAGVSAKQWDSLGTFFPSVGLTSEKTFVFLARDLSVDLPSSNEMMEDIRVERISYKGLCRMLPETDASGFFLSSLRLYERWKAENV